jgi:hypothetical protein|tara:strand:+ start:503 stop:634 length:132 start_codon:yes stop_codon:yes gene_type:complete
VRYLEKLVDKLAKVRKMEKYYEQSEILENKKSSQLAAFICLNY